MTIKDICRIAVVLAAFYLAFPYLLSLSRWLFSTPEVEVAYDISVTGHITGSYVSRQYYLHYLDGNNKVYYDFNLFEPATPLPTGLTQEEINRLGLGPYLRKGDYITKAAQSTTLSVHRGNSTTQWVCAKKPHKQ